MTSGESIADRRDGQMWSVFDGSGHDGGAVKRAAGYRASAMAIAVALFWVAPLPADRGAFDPGLGTAAARAGAYRPDGPEKSDPKKAKTKKTKAAEQKPHLGKPLDELPPATEIEPKGVSPAIADLLRHGADAGAMGASSDLDTDSVNVIGPIKSVAGAPWVVEPKRPPDDIIVVEGETSKFNQAVNMGEWLDYFFNDERLEDEINYTRLRFRGDAFYQEGQSVDLKPDVNFKLSVPGLERRMVLFFNGDLNDGFDDTLTGDRLDPEEEDNALLGLQTFFNATRSLNVSLRGGVRFHNGAPVLFAGPRYRRIFDLDPWAVRVTAEARWYTDEGVATRAYFDFDRRFSDDLFFRFTPGASWSEEEENLKYRANLRLYHRLSNNTVLRYSAFATFDTNTPDSLVDARFRVAWRQRVIRDWLVVELAPEVTFPAERDYHPTWGVLLRLETTFDIHMPWWND